MSRQLSIEVVATTPERQVLLEMQVEEGATVADVIETSQILRRFPTLDTGSLKFGIWGRVVERDHPVCDGDRVEVYRPLAIDPREARRQRALLGKTMRGD